jgi:hypothetical protein
MLRGKRFAPHRRTRPHAHTPAHAHTPPEFSLLEHQHLSNALDSVDLSSYLLRLRAIDLIAW